MAGIGLYGVYYSKATIVDGVLTGYTGLKTMGKAIAANFAPDEVDDNPLRANNGIAETDAQAAAGGTLQLTLDRLKIDAQADLFGLTKETETVTVGTESVSGTGFDYTGEEEAAVVGVAFIRQKQEEQDRDLHEAVIFSYNTFKTPTDDYATLGENVDWQTPELEATVSGGAVTGAYPWRKDYTFPSQAAAIQFITNYFAAPTPDPGVS